MALISRAACLAAAAASLIVFAATPVRPASPEDKSHTDTMWITPKPDPNAPAVAAFSLGLLYDLGSVGGRDPEAALLWYQTAAEAGLPEAAFNVGALYDSGHGVPRDTTKAALWYAKAAARGHHRAQFDLGQLYEQGDGVPRNQDAAAGWFQEAAAGGIAAAAVHLRTMRAAKSSRPTDVLTAVTSAWPGKNQTLALTGENPIAELVWIAPAEPQPVRYLVQVRQLGDSRLHTVFTASVMQTAVQVRLPTTPDFYVWRVDAVGRDGSRAPGEWSWFSVGTPAPAQQSSASMTESAAMGH